jgi:hypothetical protein
MKSTSTNTVYRCGGRGMGFAGWLFLLFLALKLTGYITWSWWWITAPLWAPFIIGLSIGLIVLLIALIAGVILAVFRR